MTVKKVTVTMIALLTEKDGKGGNMIYFIGGLMIVLCIAMAFGIGYYMGQGKVEIKRVMNEKDSQQLKEAQIAALKAQMESHEQWQKMAQEYQQEGVL